jgi:hypothetical protein
MPERMPDKISDRMPEDMPDRMPEDMPDRMPNRMPEDMPDRIPEDMPDRMSEDLPVTKRINVMVGISRSKVFFGSQCSRFSDKHVQPLHVHGVIFDWYPNSRPIPCRVLAMK